MSGSPPGDSVLWAAPPGPSADPSHTEEAYTHLSQDPLVKDRNKYLKGRGRPWSVENLTRAQSRGHIHIIAVPNYTQTNCRIERHHLSMKEYMQP